jgi:hypothetical protein
MVLKLTSWRVIVAITFIGLMTSCSMMTEEEKAAEIKKYWDCKNAGSKPYWYERRLQHCLSPSEVRKNELAAHECNISGYEPVRSKSGKFIECSSLRNTSYIVN